MENVQFVNQYEITPKLMRSWRSLFGKRAGKHRQWCMLFTALVFTALIAWSIILIREYPGFLYQSSIFSFFFLLPLIYFQLRSDFSGPGVISDQYERISGEPTWIQTLCFGEEIEVKNSISRTYCSYDLIRFIDEGTDCFYLWIELEFLLNDRAGQVNLVTGVDSLLVVYKDAFLLGNADEFCAFISEKCGKKEPLLTKQEINRIALEKWGLYMVVVAACAFVFIMINHTSLNSYLEHLRFLERFSSPDTFPR